MGDVVAMDDSRTRSTPAVSVVIPTHNRAGLLPRAIRSVIEQNDATVSVEAVVVDDGSTDETQLLIPEFPTFVRWIRLPRNQGRNHARNLGLDQVSGDFVKFLDSDDYLEPGSLVCEVMVALQRNADIVASGYRVGPSETGAYVDYRAPFFTCGIDSILAGEAVPTSAALYRRQYLQGMTWDESLSKLDDWDFFVRAFLHGGRVAVRDGISYTWVTHSGQGVLKATLLQNALEHHAILAKIENHLSASGELTTARKRRLAQYYYKEIRVLCVHDRKAFDKAVIHIRDLDPQFVPRDEERQMLMRFLGRGLGFRAAVVLHTAIKRLVKGDSGTL